MMYFKKWFVAFVLSCTFFAQPVLAETQYPLEADSAALNTVAIEAVNINTATVEQLAVVLDGVGIKRAEAIVKYRESNGPFSDAAELQQIKGIGEVIVDKNRGKISL